MISSLRANRSSRDRWGENRGVRGRQEDEQEDMVLPSTGTRGRKRRHTNNHKNMNEDDTTAVMIMRANISWHNLKYST